MEMSYQLGPFRLDPSTGVMLYEDEPVALGPRAVAVLVTLVTHADRYVTKEVILAAAWPGLVVEESNLAAQISAIRRAFRIVPGADRWVETLPKRGYRFVGPVTALVEKMPSSAGDASARSNLPPPRTSFVGRERELAELQRLLRGNRALTLTGTGGVGKTRLGLCIATTMLDSYRDGVWLVELATLRHPDLVPQAVISALELKEQPGKRLTHTLIDHLQPKHLLLVLDNAEHLLVACAELADTLLRQCPKVTILTTSRERLGVPGELTYRVPSLSIPEPKRDISAPDLVDYESVRLFSERAQLHVPNFAVTDRNAPALANICRRLDGNALAIELAAARVRSMSVEEVNQRLDRRFSLLTGGSRTVPRRQQTLRAAIDWSYDLLSDAEKALFCAVSVFAGGFTLEAAERICPGEDIEARDVLDLLTSLVDKSLVIAEERVASTRYRMLETVQQYAAEVLHVGGNEAYWQRRHALYFVELAEEAEPQLTGQNQQAWLERLETEHDNIRFALSQLTHTGGDSEAGLRLSSAVSRFWLVRGYLHEGRAWLSRLLAATPGAQKMTRAKAINWAGILAWKQGDYPSAHAAYEQSLAMRREMGDRRGVGAVLNNQGLLAYEQGDYAAARVLHEESLAVDRELGDRWGVAVSLAHLGGLAMMQGDYRSARAANEESLAIFRELGDRGHVANALRNLASLYIQEGDPAAARTLFDESLVICRELGDRSGIAWARNGLGVTARHEDDRPVARELFEESLATFRELGDREGIANALNNLGLVAAARGDLPAASALQDESLAIYSALGDRSGIATSIEGLAGIAFARGEPERAACMFGAMERLRAEIGAPLVQSERHHYERTLAGACAALENVAAFDLAWRTGRAMTLEQAIAYAMRKNVA